MAHDENFQLNIDRYDALLKKYGFELAPGYTEKDRAVWSHVNDWAVELRGNRVWRLINPDGKTLRSDSYLNDLESALESRVKSGAFVK